MLSREYILEEFYHYLESAGHVDIYERDFVNMPDDKLKAIYKEIFEEGKDIIFSDGSSCKKDDGLATEEELLMMGFFGGF